MTRAGLLPRPRGRWPFPLLAAGALALGAVDPAPAHERRADTRPAALREVAFDQRLNEGVPWDLAFHDETGKSVRLGDYFGTRPVILVPVYFRCRNLCPLVLDGLVRALRVLAFDVGHHFAVVTVSFDARDNPATAAAKKGEILSRYGRPGTTAGWPFLTGKDGLVIMNVLRLAGLATVAALGAFIAVMTRRERRGRV